MRTFGIERERFIVDSQGNVVPAIGTLLPQVHRIASEKQMSEDLFTFELFAGQIEDRTHPCVGLDGVRTALIANDAVLLESSKRLGLTLDCSEFVEKERVTAFEVNPFDRRHQEIWKSIPTDVQIAASVVAAVHVHISVSEKEAVRVLNLCREEAVNYLIDVGDHSSLRRIKAYREMAGTDGVPPIFTSFEEVMLYISSKGGEKNVWDLIRYKPCTKTVEFRMFGATDDVEEVLGYIKACCYVSKIC